MDTVNAVDACNECHKRSHIMIKCMCGNNYCLSHKYPDIHNCTFDHRKASRERRERNNPKIEAEKIKKI